MATEELKINTEAFMGDLVKRVSRLESDQAELVKRSYEFDKELSGVHIDLKYIREGLDQTKGGINKLLFGIALVFITYVGGFVFSGGLVTGVTP